MKRTIGISLVTGEQVEFFDATVCRDHRSSKANTASGMAVAHDHGATPKGECVPTMAPSVASSLSTLRRIIYPRESRT